MHKVEIRREIVERVLARRGKLHLYGSLDKVALLSDRTAALSDDEQRATLENVIQQFGDVVTSAEALHLLDPSRTR